MNIVIYGSGCCGSVRMGERGRFRTNRLAIGKGASDRGLYNYRFGNSSDVVGKNKYAKWYWEWRRV